MSMMTPRQAVFTIALAILLFVFVIELVRRRQLKEEYSWLWIVATGATLILVSWPAALRAIIGMSGASKATTVIFMLAVAFLAVVSIHLCMKLTEANREIKRMAQHIGILRRRRAQQSERNSQEPELGAPCPNGEESKKA